MQDLCWFGLGCPRTVAITILYSAALRLRVFRMVQWTQIRRNRVRPSWRHARRLVIYCCVALVCVANAGCVRRRLTVRTNPPGAQVFVDDQEIGVTPCSASFIYYGTRKITVMKDGYKTETLFQRINPPWYEIPPLDFVSENLISRELRDERIVDVQLAPEEIVPQQKLIDRAQALRDSAASGVVTPLLANPAAANGPVREPPLSLPGQGLPGGQPLPYEPLPGPASVAPPGR